MPATKVGVSPARARELTLALPGVEAGTSYGVPAFKVGKKFFVRLRDDDTVLVVHPVPFTDRDFLLADAPRVFFTTDHYRNHPSILVRLAEVREPALRELLVDAWRRIASRELTAKLDAR